MGLNENAPCLVLACDLPLLESYVLEEIANWPGDRSVLPVIDGFAQPLCARWSSQDLGRAGVAFDEGVRSLQRLPDRDHAVLVDECFWEGHAVAFYDADTPEDLARLGILSDGSRPQ